MRKNQMLQCVSWLVSSRRISHSRRGPDHEACDRVQDDAVSLQRAGEEITLGRLGMVWPRVRITVRTAGARWSTTPARHYSRSLPPMIPSSRVTFMWSRTRLRNDSGTSRLGMKVNSDPGKGQV